jgi:hypothetical protein
MLEHGVDRQSDPLNDCHAIDAINYHWNHLDNPYVTDTEIRSLTPKKLAAVMPSASNTRNFQEHPDRSGQGKGPNHEYQVTTFAALQMCTPVPVVQKGGELSIDDSNDQYYRLINPSSPRADAERHPDPGKGFIRISTIGASLRSLPATTPNEVSNEKVSADWC